MKTKKISVIAFVFSVLSSHALMANTLKGKYELKSSKIDYVVKYLIKKAEGSSTAAKGKGECSDIGCDFLVAAPIKSFNSKDSNRDFNMLKATKADKFPVVVAKIKAPVDLTADFKTDVEIEFAGEKHTYPGVVFKTSGNAQSFNAAGTLNVSLNNYKIEKPSLMGVDIEDTMPVTINAQWEQGKK
jgi:hypothetical protein